MTHRRRVTDRLPLSDIVSRGNLDDRLTAVRERMDGHWTLDDERWLAHAEVHRTDSITMRDYKREANEWRSTLSDLRLTFIPKAEFQSEHRALDAKLHGEISSLAALVSTIDARVDANTAALVASSTEQTARRGVFSDSRNVLAAIGVAIGIVASALLLIDRVAR